MARLQILNDHPSVCLVRLAVRKARWFVAGLVLFVAGGIALLAFPREPRYARRPLDSWLQEFPRMIHPAGNKWNPSPDERAPVEPAAQAIRLMGKKAHAQLAAELNPTKGMVTRAKHATISATVRLLL